LPVTGTVRVDYHCDNFIQNPQNLGNFPPLLTSNSGLISFFMGSMSLYDSKGEYIFCPKPIKMKTKIPETMSIEAA
jgi:hypothetical protein